MHACLGTMCMSGTLRAQKLDSLELGLQVSELPCGCLEANLDSLEEQQVCLVTERCLQPTGGFQCYFMCVVGR